MEPISISTNSRQGFIRHRYVLCSFISSGLALAYAMRVNLSVAILPMTNLNNASVAQLNHTGVVNDSHVNYIDKITNAEQFDWDTETKQELLGAFFYGYLSTQIFGGIMASKFCPKKVFGYGIFLTSIFTITTAWVARWSVKAFVALRVLEGVTEGVTVPAMFCLLSRWTPKNERSTMSVLCGIGTSIGTIVAMPMTALLCNSGLGWPASFYFPGATGVVWTLAWFAFMTPRPETHPWISEYECNYITENRGTRHAIAENIPWKKILTSPAVWVFSITRLLGNITFYMFLTGMPTFIYEAFGIGLMQNSFLNAAFYLTHACTSMSAGALSDYVIAKEVSSKTIVRKLFQCSSFIFAGTMLLIVTGVGHNYNALAGLLCFAAFAIGLSAGGEVPLPLDLSPEHAGIVTAIASTVAGLAAIVATNLVSITHDPSNLQKGWNTAFVATAVTSFTGAAIFGFFGTAKQQLWSMGTSETTN